MKKVRVIIRDDPVPIGEDKVKSLIEYAHIIKYIVYYLLDGDELLYIGATTNLYNRIGTHLCNEKIPFNRVLYEECDSRRSLLDLEREMIKKYRPLYNSMSLTGKMNKSHIRRFNY